MLDRLACGEDPRAGVKIRTEAAERELAARGRRPPEELATFVAPAVKRGSGKKHERPFDDDLGCVGVGT